MNSGEAPVRIFGVPFSQPVRAVLWLMLYKRMPFELVLTNPGSQGDNGSRHPDFLQMNPAGTIPTMQEPDTGYVLGEAHAIMTYLSNRHGWHDVYPLDWQQRGRIDWYLNYHHRNVREASLGLVAPKIRKDLDIPEAAQNQARATLTQALKALENGWLAHSRFLAGSAVTLADFAAYVEIGQLQPGFTNVYDFAEFPRVQQWLNDMQRVDGHDAVHVVLSELGDISTTAPDMDSIRNANKNALRALKECLASLA